ncbi:hypothetical protein SAMN04488591_1914 [Microbacterium azadirachtae]|jgi:hypothetical protein|uniref:Uncharacterized protein n=1 Tax=Microbacterium azadirachtae TaxID=582680 RepID=A0A1I6HKI7_9MICO|nr:hypothetical protein [Microbacterium azadirachtae]SFR54993.1 hypothetical protein SAMN04488591_1914 [Microbacterium azadirachtae]
MTSGFRILLHSFAGLVLGVCVVFLAIAASLVMAFTTAGDVTIPGVIRIWRATENGATALNFVPNIAGMGIAVVLIAGLYVLVSTLLGARVRRASEAAHPEAAR